MNLFTGHKSDAVHLIPVPSSSNTLTSADYGSEEEGGMNLLPDPPYFVHWFRDHVRQGTLDILLSFWH